MRHNIGKIFDIIVLLYQANVDKLWKQYFFYFYCQRVQHLHLDVERTKLYVILIGIFCVRVFC